MRGRAAHTGCRRELSAAFTAPSAPSERSRQSSARRSAVQRSVNVFFMVSGSPANGGTCAVLSFEMMHFPVCVPA